MINYAEIAEGALTAIRDAGTKVVITRMTKTLNPTTSEVTEAVELSAEFDVVILPAKKANAVAHFQVGFDNGYVEALRAGKVRALLVAASGAEFQPQQGDSAVFAGLTWRLLGCTAIDPTGASPVIFKTEVIQQ